MNKILKTTALCLCAATLFSSTAFAKDFSVPLRETFEKSGFSVSWDQESRCVTIEKGGFRHRERVGENIRLDFGKTYVTEDFAKNIIDSCIREERSTKATVIEVGEGYILANSEKMGEVMFKVDDETFFRHEKNRCLYTLEDVEVGSVIKIDFADAMTASIPPQVYAYEIIFTDSEEAAAIESGTSSGKVTEVEEDFFVIETENGEYRFNCDEKTFFHHIMNKKIYKISDLEEDMEVEVIHSIAATMSIPPQSYAYEVVIK